MNIDKYYNFISLFDDSQEKAILAIRDLTACDFKTEKIRSIISNIKLEGRGENFFIIEPFMDVIFEMVDNGFNLDQLLREDKYASLDDDYLFKMEEANENDFIKYSQEMEILGMNGKHLEYLYYREAAIIDKYEKELKRLKIKNNEQKIKLSNKDIKIRDKDKKISLLRNGKSSKKQKTKVYINQLAMF